MRFTEFAPTRPTQPIRRPYVVEPDQVKRARLVNRMATAIAFRRSIRKPTPDDQAMAFAVYSQTQRKANRDFEKAQQSRRTNVGEQCEQDSQLFEVADQMQTFIAAVRLQMGNNTPIVRTQLRAPSFAQAFRLLEFLYGKGNVMQMFPVRYRHRQ